MASDHMNINQLHSQLAANADLPLKFYFEGLAIKPGYHVTEVKHASIKSIDCGRASEQENWDEITIQLLDGSAISAQGHMQTAKFVGIVSGALKTLSETTASQLFFEYAPGNGPIRKLKIESVAVSDKEIAVSLGGDKAVCKPFERMKDKATAAVKGCCTGGDSGPENKPCCG